MAARDMRNFAGDIGYQTFYQGISLVVVAIIIFVVDVAIFIVFLERALQPMPRFQVRPERERFCLPKQPPTERSKRSQSKPARAEGGGRFEPGSSQRSTHSKFVIIHLLT